LKLTIQTLGPGFNPANYTIIGGTEGNDDFTGQATAGHDVFCGFVGSDFIATLDEGDIFFGGAETDLVVYSYGTFYGQEGDDYVYDDNGTFVQ
jgi:hypothetical protein